MTEAANALRATLVAQLTASYAVAAAARRPHGEILADHYMQAMERGTLHGAALASKAAEPATSLALARAMAAAQQLSAASALLDAGAWPFGPLSVQRILSLVPTEAVATVGNLIRDALDLVNPMLSDVATPGLTDAELQTLVAVASERYPGTLEQQTEILPRLQSRGLVRRTEAGGIGHYVLTPKTGPVLRSALAPPLKPLPPPLQPMQIVDTDCSNS